VCRRRVVDAHRKPDIVQDEAVDVDAAAFEGLCRIDAELIDSQETSIIAFLSTLTLTFAPVPTSNYVLVLTSI
jgi:hypothetical protein